MQDVIEVFDELLRPIYQPLLPHLVHALIVVAVTVAAVAFGLPWLIRGGHRLVTRTPRPLHKAKRELLANGKIVELYAPAQRYTRDLREKERPRQWAGLSPFPIAVRESIRRNNTPNGQKLDARKQIAAASKCVKVRKPHESDNIGGDLLKHYRIDLALDGHTENEIKGLEAYVKSSLKLHTIERHQTGSQSWVTFIAHEEPPVDILIERKKGVEFLDENAAESPLRLPIAVTESGKPWYFDIHHTLIFGMSGSGKGSPIQASIRQLAPFAAQGLVKIHGIDPKKAEFKGYEVLNSSLFEKITSGLTPEAMEEHGEHIAELLEIVDARQRVNNVSVTEGEVEMGRSFKVSKKYPLVVVFIDEYLTLYRGFQKMGRAAKVHMANLEQLMAVARSFNVFVVAATQRASADVLDELRPNITNWIILRQRNKHFNEVFLGDDSIELGYDSRQIGPSTPANGYQTSGIGYAANERGEIEKIRFAYLGDDDVAQLIRDYEREHGRGDIAENQLDEFEDVMELPTLDDDFLFEGGEEDDGDFKIEELPTLDDD